MAGLAYVSNIQLWREGGYFGTPALFKPLHHLWSLAVEEQFYLLWPWLLWLGHRASRRGVGLVIAGVIAASFAANLVLTLDDPDAATVRSRGKRSPNSRHGSPSWVGPAASWW